MPRNGREVRSWTDYILGTDRRLFRNVALWDPWHNLDHYMVLGCLPSAPLIEHRRYLGGTKRWLVRPPVKLTRTDQLFAALHATARGKTKRLYLRDNVDNHQRESLCTPGPTIMAGVHMVNWVGGL